MSTNESGIECSKCGSFNCVYVCIYCYETALKTQENDLIKDNKCIYCDEFGQICLNCHKRDLTKLAENWTTRLDENNTIKSIWNKQIIFNDEYFKGWRNTELIFYSNALSGEVGEFCNKVKKFYGGGTRGDKVTPEDLIEELSDVMIYLILSSELIGFSCEDFIKEFNKKTDLNMTRMKERLKGDSIEKIN